MANEKVKVTTISVSGAEDHQKVIDFAASLGLWVKVWGKRGPGKKNNAVNSVDNTDATE